MPGPATAVSARGTAVIGVVAETCAILADKTLWCWGNNSQGQLGVNDTVNHTGPQAVALPSNAQITQVSVGAEYACAVDTNQDLWCWGNNTWGQVGDGNATSPVKSPTVVAHSILSVAAGEVHTCAIGAIGGGLSCWGSNGYGELGNGTTNVNVNATPSPTSMVDVSEVVAGHESTCARDGLGLYCWGLNGNGQLGIGSTTNQSWPAAVSLSGEKLLAYGVSHGGAITGAGLFVWGTNADGQLGDGEAVDSHSPKAISFANASALSLGANSSCALTMTGKLYCWGSNAFGQLGNGTTSDSSTPAPVVWP